MTQALTSSVLSSSSSCSCLLISAVSGTLAHTGVGSLGAILFTSIPASGGALFGATYGVTYTLVHLCLSYFVKENSCFEIGVRQIASHAFAILSSTLSCSLAGYCITFAQGALLALSMIATTLLISALFMGFVCCCLPCCLSCCVPNE